MNKLQEIFQAWNISFNPNEEQSELAAKRIEVCNGCEHKRNLAGINSCGLCGCALKRKVFSPVKGACPDGRWDNIDNPRYSKYTTFVQIAAYRDPELLKTIDSLLSNAQYPENLKICIAWQHAKEDKWDTLKQYKKDNRFIILDIPYQEAKGACWARNLIQQHYNGEDFTLQLDSHHRFTKNWDITLFDMFFQLKSPRVPKPLITGYLPGYFPKEDPKKRQNEVWQMDFHRFTPQGYIFTWPSIKEDWQNLDAPFRSRFYSAHFAFTIGDFCREVQHDPEMYFHGEEPSIAARAFTWGYDLFHPHKVVAWHEYTRDGKKKHWDDSKNWNDLDSLSYLRYRVLHGMEEHPEVKYTDILPYGFGPVRSLREYELYAGVRFKDKKVEQQTLDKLPPPNKFYADEIHNRRIVEGEYEKQLVSLVKHCIDIYKEHFQHNDYEYWVVSFEKNDGTVIYREDAGPQEVKSHLKSKDDWVKIWREFTGEYPDKWVVWPYSKSKGFVERLEQKL